MTEDATPLKRVKLTREQLQTMTKEELLDKYMEQEAALESVAIKPESETGKDDDTKVKSASEASRRENVLVMRLTSKEQELQDYMNQVAELKQAQNPSTAQLRSMLLDPAINLMFQRMKREMDQCREKQEQAQNDLAAWKFTSDSQTGKRLMARCRLLLQENEDLGKVICSGRTAKLEGEIALEKTLVQEMKKSQTEMDEFLCELDEDVEGMQSTIYLLQQQLRETKAQLDALQASAANGRDNTQVASAERRPRGASRKVPDEWGGQGRKDLDGGRVGRKDGGKDRRQEWTEEVVCKREKLDEFEIKQERIMADDVAESCELMRTTDIDDRQSPNSKGFMRTIDVDDRQSQNPRGFMRTADIDDRETVNSRALILKSPVDLQYPNSRSLLSKSPVDVQYPNSRGLLSKSPVDFQSPNSKGLMSKSPVDNENPNSKGLIPKSPNSNSPGSKSPESRSPNTKHYHINDHSEEWPRNNGKVMPDDHEDMSEPIIKTENRTEPIVKSENWTEPSVKSENRTEPIVNGSITTETSDTEVKIEIVDEGE